MKAMKASLKGAGKSLTIWFNSIMGALVVALPMAQDQLPQLQSYLPESVYHTMMGVMIAGNILLRFRTSKALADK